MQQTKPSDTWHTAFEAIQRSNAEALRAALSKLESAELSHLGGGANETLHQAAVRGVVINTMLEHPSAVGSYECARLMLATESPCADADGRTAMYWFLHGNWAGSPHDSLVADLMREHIARGLIDVKSLFVANLEEADKSTLPLTMAIRISNPLAVRELLRAGADERLALAGTGFVSLEAFSTSLNGPCRDAVVDAIRERSTPAPTPRRRAKP